MRTLIFAALAAVAVTGISPAMADEGDAVVANTQFTQLPGVIALAPVPGVPLVAMARDGQGEAAYITQTNPGVWLFPPHDGGGDNL